MSQVSSGHAEKTAIKPEIQALRAIAVVVVVLYHLWPGRMRGGYIGVDMFFVISGYLITSHLWRSASTGRLTLVSFYSRRIRRLAPAAILVSMFIIVSTYAVVPIGKWAQFAKEIMGSVFLIENWVLAHDSVDYLAAENAPTPTQHFWSLSVEEQFYLFWPLIILIVLWLLKKQSDKVRLNATTATLGVVMVASFGYCLWVTANDPLPAYFVTPARVWQFAAGGILGLVHMRLSLRDAPGRTRPAAAGMLALASWSGLLLLLVASWALDASRFTYPGVWALAPVVGTLLVIIGGSNQGRWGAQRLLGWRPTQYVGDISYSVYLWHWPLVVFAPYALGRDVRLADKVVILALTFIAAALATKYVENTIRFSPRLASRHLVSAAVAGAIAATFVVAPSQALVMSASTQIESANNRNLEQISGGNPCFGALSMTNKERCLPLEGKLTDAVVAAAAEDVPAPFAQHCIDPLARHVKKVCNYGDKNATDTVLVWGDSHAAAWASAFDLAGKLAHRRVIVATRQGCPAYLGGAHATVFRAVSAREQRDCAARNEQILNLVKNDRSITTVVLSSYSTNYRDQPGDTHPDYAKTLDLLKQLRAAGPRIVLLSDVPLTGRDAAHRTDVPACLSRHLDHPQRCNNTPKVALNTDGLVRAVRASPEAAAVTIVDTSTQFCDQTWCYAAMGGIPVFTDESHISATFSLSLGPWVAKHVLTR